MTMPATTADPQARRDYLLRRKKARVEVYFQDETEKASFYALARSQGATNFSQWIVQRLIASLSGAVYPAGYVEDLQKSVERYRTWLADKDQQIAELRKDLKVSEAEREDLRVVVAALSGKQTPAGAPLEARA